MKNVFLNVLKALASLVLFFLVIIVLWNGGPVFDFQDAKPFSGDFIYNPYAEFDSTYGWSRANFHCHTKVYSIIEECDFSPEETFNFLEPYDFKIATVSNHMKITPLVKNDLIADPVTVYEHGYNLFNNHHLVFNPDKVCFFDYVTPFFASQKQFLTDILLKKCDFVVFNHIQRLRAFNPKQMEKLSGYLLVEGDCNFDDGGSELAYWDIALSAGHYSGNILNDDLHFPDNTEFLARRSTFLNIKGTSYEDLKAAFTSGNFYAMKVPDFGNGDVAVKKDMNKNLPYIEDIGLTGDTIIMNLSQTPELVEAVGQDGIRIPLNRFDGDIYKYTFKESDTYIRLHADFGSAYELYTNPFARSIDGNRPSNNQEHPVNIVKTILYNLAIAAIAFCLMALLARVFPRRKK